MWERAHSRLARITLPCLQRAVPAAWLVGGPLDRVMPFEPSSARRSRIASSRYPIALLVTQRDQRIDTSGAARREIAGRESGHRHHRDHAPERDGIVR